MQISWAIFCFTWPSDLQLLGLGFEIYARFDLASIYRSKLEKSTRDPFYERTIRKKGKEEQLKYFIKYQVKCHLISRQRETFNAWNSGQTKWKSKWEIAHVVFFAISPITISHTEIWFRCNSSASEISHFIVAVEITFSEGDDLNDILWKMPTSVLWASTYIVL